MFNFKQIDITDNSNLQPMRTSILAISDYSTVGVSIHEYIILLCSFCLFLVSFISDIFYCYRDRRRVQCSVHTRPAQQTRELRAFTVRDSEQSRAGEGESGSRQYPVRSRRPCRQDDGQVQGRVPAQLKGVRHIMNVRCVLKT